MASMKKEEARRAVLSEYDRWAKKHPNDASVMGGFLFFRYLQKERSDLLDFRSVGDKWQSFTAGYGIGWKIRLTHPTHVLRIKSSMHSCFASRAWRQFPCAGVKVVVGVG
jgi:hypothetical protein